MRRSRLKVMVRLTQKATALPEWESIPACQVVFSLHQFLIMHQAVRPILKVLRAHSPTGRLGMASKTIAPSE